MCAPRALADAERKMLFGRGGDPTIILRSGSQRVVVIEETLPDRGTAR
jgi:hypothetical protein